MEKHSFQQVTNSLQETSDFAEYLSYDANGNILTANRNASLTSAGGQAMDNLNYKYLNNTNKLNFVTDQISPSAKDYDIDGQPFQNYTYDKIGNLVADKQESITNINWSVYGKIRGIIKRNTTTGKETSTQYGYDPSGNRTYKEVIRRDIGNYSQDIVDRTYYVRDAQGNTMATYTKHEEPGNTPNLKWSEQHLYGSSRLGVMNLNLDIPAQPMIPQVNQTLADNLQTGQVVYELTNHLGNVMATISDKKLFSNIVIPETGVAAFYYPEVLSQTDYYAFGQEIKERSYRISGGYRYGFNGKENDNEVKGEGNQQDYGMRIYDPRLGRFLSVDPLTSEYPWYTPYQFAGNRPSVAIDIDGLEPHDVTTHQLKTDLKPNAAEHTLNSNPISNGKNITPWKDLLNFKVPSNLVEQMKSRLNGGVQEIERAVGTNTNFDFYTVQINRLPNGIKNPGELLEKIRLSLGDFMDSKTSFAAYNPTERKLWNSNNPLGSVLSFDAKFSSLNLNLDDASVMTSSYFRNESGGFWTFSTLTTDGDGYHPIAGTRQFGVSTVNGSNGSTSYLFYIRATDRAYGAIEAMLQKTVFSSAETTWKAVCWNIFKYINNNGGDASLPPTPISKRIPWSEVQEINKNERK